MVLGKERPINGLVKWNGLKNSSGGQKTSKKRAWDFICVGNMRVGWVFILNTEKAATADKLVKRVNKVLATESLLPNLEKYYKGGYKYFLYTEHSDFKEIRKLLTEICFHWDSVSWHRIEGIASKSIRIVGVNWVHFWINETELEWKET